MSIIKSIKQVLGFGPAAENHFWDGSVPNQLSLKRGTPEVPGATVMQVLNGRVEKFMDGRTWQDVSGSRNSGTTYTNDTENTIQVSVLITSVVGGACSLSIDAGGLTVFYQYLAPVSGLQQAVTGVIDVPPGADYRATWTSAAASAWMELR